MSKAGKMPVDREARLRAISNLDTSLCLEAGAGTGKTTILVERFISIIRSGRAECASIAAITFTEKAAAEMKDRVLLRVEQLLASGEPSGEEMERLERARTDLERAQISTIHAFAAAVLREFPLEAVVDPDFQQLDGLDSTLFEDESFMEFLGEAAGKHEEALRKLMPLGRPSRCVELLREITFHWYHDRTSRAAGGIFEETSSAAASLRGVFDPDRHRRYLVSSADRLMELAKNGCVSPEDKGLEQITAFFSETRHIEGLEGEDLASRLLSVSPPKAKGNQGNWSPKEACAEQKSLCREIAGAHEGFIEAYMDDLRDSLEGWCTGFERYTAERKRRAGVLDFDDLLIGARRLFDDEGALESLRGRYRYLLVDEFQDTDPLQAELIMLLAGRPGSAGIDPEPGKLFVVGDPKQSIYRFRRADVEIYEQVKEAIARSGSVISITQNFRSVPGIIEWVNAAFSSLIKKPVDGRYMPGYEPVHAMREGTGGAVVRLDLETSAKRSDEFRREEGEAVARFVRDLVDSCREVLDPVTKEMRPVRYGDIALVYRSTTGIDRYEDPLREADIPYLVEGGKLYYTRQEVRDLASAVWVVEDPYDSVALLALLRSPMFGFSDEEIFLFTRAGGRLCYLDPGQPGEGFEDFLASFDLLSTLHTERNTAGPAATLGRLLARTGYLSSSKLRAHGEQRILNLRKAVQTARLFEEKGRSFRYYARWMRDQDTLGAAEGESPAVDGGENAVRMITIHKAKGLQFPVVVLVNLVQAMHGAGRLIGRGGRMPALRVDGRSTGDYEAARAMEERMDTAETIRMLYVAATRAGDMLVIPAVPLDRRGRPPIFGFIASPVEEVPGVKVSDLPVLPPGPGPFPVMPRLIPSGLARGAEIREKWAAGRKLLLESSPPGPVQVSPSGLEICAGTPRAGQGGEDGPVGEAGGEREAALDLGRAFHRMMEIVLDPRNPAQPDEAAQKAAEEFGIYLRDELIALGSKALGSEIVARAAAAEKVLVEPPFTLRVDSKSGEGGILTGRLDLVFESGGGWTAVDFKTDDIDAAGVGERLEAYRPQGAAYAYALERLGISPVVEVIFYFVRPGIAASAGSGRELAARGAGLVGGAISASTPSTP